MVTSRIPVVLESLSESVVVVWFWQRTVTRGIGIALRVEYFDHGIERRA